MNAVTVVIIGLGWLFSKGCETKYEYQLVSQKEKPEDEAEDDLLSGFDEDAMPSTPKGWHKIWEGMHESKW